MTAATHYAEIHAARNEERLALCDPEAVPRFRAALERVIAYGEAAYIERDPWRSPEQQGEKVELGFSRTLQSAHCHTRGCNLSTPGVFVEHRCWPVFKPDGSVQPSPCGAIPASRAIHIIGPEFYAAQIPFWLRVGAAAVTESLIWGGLYPPRDKDRDKLDYFDMHVRPELRSALYGERWHEADIILTAGRRLGACWDPAHVEWRPAP